MPISSGECRVTILVRSGGDNSDRRASHRYAGRSANHAHHSNDLSPKGCCEQNSHHAAHQQKQGEVHDRPFQLLAAGNQIGRGT